LAAVSINCGRVQRKHSVFLSHIYDITPTQQHSQIVNAHHTSYKQTHTHTHSLSSVYIHTYTHTRTLIHTFFFLFCLYLSRAYLSPFATEAHTLFYGHHFLSGNCMHQQLYFHMCILIHFPLSTYSPPLHTLIHTNTLMRAHS
jgi:hypothetical protein